MKNLFKKFIVLFSLVFIVFGFNFVNANLEEIPTPLLECISPQILNENKDTCVDDPSLDIEVLICVPPQIINETGDTCVDLDPPVVCIEGEELDPETNICATIPVLEEKLTIDELADVPKSCTVLDLDGVEHSYTSPSYDSYLGICALQSLIDSQKLSYAGFSNAYPSMGLFVTKFNEVEADPFSEYWALYKNEGFAEEGISTLPITVGDVVSFKLSDFSGVETGDYVNITINSLIPHEEDSKEEEADTEENNSSGNSGGGSSYYDSFSLEDSISFLLDNQEGDGSFGEDMYTDWVAIGISKIDLDDDSILNNLKEFILSSEIGGDTVTDYARRVMSLLSLSINPYDDTNINYIEEIIKEFDGDQMGDKNLFNDDIFSLLVLAHVGYEEDDEIIKSIVSFIISNQNSNGSFGSTDMTGAGIMALNNFKNVEGVEDVITKAEEYLLDNQNDDGGFGNVYSTSWALQALIEINSNRGDIEEAIKYLKESQLEDGSFVDGSISNKIWATSYILPAIYELSWNDILEDFDKQEKEESNDVSKDEKTIVLNEEKIEILKNEKVEENSDILVLKESEYVVIAKKEKEIVKNNLEELEEIENFEFENNINEGDLLASAGDVPDVDTDRFFDWFHRVFSSLWNLVLNIFI